MSAMLRLRCLVALVLIAAGWPTPVRAQEGDADPPQTWETRGWVGEVTFLGANALLSGVSSGLMQWLRDGSFQDGFTRGALGGAITYSGRRIVAENFWGAGLLGRQVAGVGSSVVRNAAEDRPAFSRISLPIGPANVYLVPGGARPLSMRLDIHGTAWLVSAILDDRLQLDGDASLSAGAAVFRTPRHMIGSDGDFARGIMTGGIIVLGANAAEGADDTFAHERVHVLQYDYAQEVWGDPFEDWLATKLPGAPGLLKFVRPGILLPAIGSVVSEFVEVDWVDRPWELEAEYLEHR